MESFRVQEAQQRVSSDQWDVDSWMVLLIGAQQSTFADAKPVYEKLVAQFPPSGKIWRTYAEHMARDTLQSADDDGTPVMDLYERAVIDAPTSVELWHSYTTFASNRVGMTSTTPTLESDAISVHERAISTAGIDVKADVLWNQYFSFLTSCTSMSETQRRDALRRLHQRAVRMPMEQADVFWRNYTEFENDKSNNNGSKEAARAILSELQGRNHEVRMEFRARANRRQGLTMHSMPVPPRARSKEISQAQSWRRYIAWERSNPHSLSATELHSRIVHAFESALVPLYRYSEFWVEYIGYLFELFKTTSSKNGASSKDTSGKHLSPTADSSNTSSGKSNSSALEIAIERCLRALPESVPAHVYANSVYVRLGKGSKGVAALETLVQKHASPLGYIHLMRANWKNDGRDVARKTFARGRKDARAAHPMMYVAAAMMEFSVNKDSKVPRNVFEFGLKNFPRNAYLALEFVNWLWGTGDTEYARVIFQKVLPDAEGTEEEVRRLWERWLQLEELVGDPASVDHVLEMWKENGVGRTGGIMQDVLRLARYDGIDGVSEDELAVIGVSKEVGVEVGPSSTRGTGGASAGTGGGSVKRDPRTGRRVDRFGNNTGKGKDGMLANDSSGLGGRRGNEIEHDVMRVARSWLDGLASMMPPFTAPLPAEDINNIMQMILDTPDSFEDTPAGRAKATLPPVTGKKRKNDDNEHHVMGSMGVPVGVGMGGNVIRQVAKQSRLR